MRTGRPIPPLTISSDERETLERWTRRASTVQALAQRARVILGRAAGKSNTRVAHELRLTNKQSGSGGRAFLLSSWTGCWTRPGPAPRAPSPTPTSRRC